MVLSGRHHESIPGPSRAPFLAQPDLDTKFSEIDYDAGRKFTFDISADRFATAGSCFSQHFGRELARRGGSLVTTETRHPLVRPVPNDGYDLFSARYGNIYTTRQLCELIDQAFGLREPIFEFAQREDGRWTDLLRPRAVGWGFTSFEEARADRIYHLDRVRAILDTATVFVFTLGLTECWENTEKGFVYPLCPGTVEGTFDGDVHRFRNLSYEECRDDLRKFCGQVRSVNPRLRVLLTVSPVCWWLHTNVAARFNHPLRRRAFCGRRQTRAAASWSLLITFHRSRLSRGRNPVACSTKRIIET